MRDTRPHLIRSAQRELPGCWFAASCYHNKRFSGMRLGFTRASPKLQINCQFYWYWSDVVTLPRQPTDYISPSLLARKKKMPYTLPKTNIAPSKAFLKMFFLLPRWDMLVVRGVIGQWTGAWECLQLACSSWQLRHKPKSLHPSISFVAHSNVFKHVLCVYIYIFIEKYVEV